VVVEPGGDLDDIYLVLTDDEGFFMGEATVSAAGGTFDMADVEDGGPYLLTMVPEEDFFWRTEYYPDTFFEQDAAPITVAGADLDLEPMTLHAMHTVHGTVVADGKPVTDMRVTGYPAGAGVTTYSHGLSTTTDEEDGTYDLLLPAGTWKIRYSGVSDDFWNELVRTWASEWYADAASFAMATPVVVPLVSDLGTTTLTDGGSISGTVRDRVTGLPVRDVDVQAIDADDRIRRTVVTRNDGTYDLDLLTTGGYQVKVLDNQAHAFVPGYYDGSATNAGATPVPVVGGQTTTGIDLTVDAVAPPDPSTVVLGGTVTDQAGVPVRGVAVSAYKTCGGTPTVTYTDLAGHYAFTGLSAPSYRLTFTDSYGAPDDDSFEVMSAAYGGPYCSSATPVPLGTTAADITLTRYGGISGSLLSQYANEPYVPPHGQIELYDASSDDVDPDYLQTVDRHGTWSFGQLKPGTYQVFFDEDYWGGYIANWWPHVPTRAEGAVINVLPGGMVSQIDGNLYAGVDCGEDLDVVGTPDPGQTLSVAPGQYCNGRDLSYSYTWLATSWQPFTQLEVGTGPSYTVQPDDWGYDLRVRLQVTGPDGTDSIDSAPMDVTRPVVQPPDPVNIVEPTISGAPQVGATLSASPGTWQDQQQLSFQYMWLRNGFDTGITTPTYVVRPEDQGASIQVRVGAARRRHYTEASSAPVVIADTGGPPPTTSGPPPGSPTLGVRARVTGRSRGRPAVRLLVRVPASSTSGVSGGNGGELVVRERSHLVTSLHARRGVNRIDLGHVRHGRHTYVVSFTGRVDGVVPPPFVVTVRVPRRH
jgi:hypothetical protein